MACREFLRKPYFAVKVGNEMGTFKKKTANIKKVCCWLSFQ
jgi:hypothetical protein